MKKIGVNRCNELTPKCKKIYTFAKQTIRKCKREGSIKNSFKNRLRAAENFNDTYLKEYEKLSDKMTATASLFTRLQLRKTNKLSRGHRFTLDEKMLCLSLYKRSPKCYSLLSKLFTLPIKRTLNLILTSVEIRPGISSRIMNVLKQNVQKLKPSERLV